MGLFLAAFAIRPIAPDLLQKTIEWLEESPAGAGTIALVFPDPEVCKTKDDWNEELLTNGTKCVIVDVLSIYSSVYFITFANVYLVN